VKKVKEESIKDRILLLFELEKEIGEDRVEGGNKYNKLIA